MANPGSPGQAQPNMPAMPKGTMIGMMVAMLVMIIVMQYRLEIGGALNVVFQVIDFDGRMPVLSLVLAGTVMITLSTVIRGLITDPLQQARIQQEQSAFNAEMRQARLENNLFKLKKLQEQQPAMMAKSMEMSTGQMKVMPVTMIVILPMYAWIFFFITYSVPAELLTVSMPWGPLDLNGKVMGFMPYWIVIYTMISLPIGQLENRFVRYFLLRKRLSELEAVH
jgi:uncharacterized membrane protein (DUF106 family)